MIQKSLYHHHDRFLVPFVLIHEKFSLSFTVLFRYKELFSLLSLSTSTDIFSLLHDFLVLLFCCFYFFFRLGSVLDVLKTKRVFPFQLWRIFGTNAGKHGSMLGSMYRDRFLFVCFCLIFLPFSFNSFLLPRFCRPRWTARKTLSA